VIRLIGVLLVVFIYSGVFAQSTDVQVWTEKGFKGQIVKKLDYGVEWTNRIGNQGFETMFPQLSMKYKITNWFRPSIDYRLILKRQLNSNYDASNRLNFNIQFSKLFDRLDLGMRFRYQYSFDNVSNANYEPDFDRAFRLKPSLSYDINNSILTPTSSIEFFYNLSSGPLGKRFTKTRLFVGVDFELSGPHDISMGYIFDQSINLPNPLSRHIFNVSYAYKIPSKKKDKPKKKGVRWL
jgi:hypothetical protein